MKIAFMLLLGAGTSWMFAQCDVKGQQVLERHQEQLTQKDCYKTSLGKYRENMVLSAWQRHRPF